MLKQSKPNQKVTFNPMKMSRKKFIILLTLLVIALFAGGGVTILLNKLLHLDSYKAQILDEVQKSLNRRVIYEKGDFSLRFGPSFTFSKVTVKEKESQANFITADRLTFKIALLPLLEKKLSFSGMVLEHPDILLSRDSKGIFNIGDLLEEKKTAVSMQLKGIRIKNGTIRFHDMAITPSGINTVLEETDLAISHFARGKKSDVKLTAILASGNRKSPVSIAGTAKLPASDKPMGETVLNMNVTAKKLDAAYFWPYYSNYVPFQKIFGQLDIDSSFKGKFTSFTSKGEIRVAGLRFNYPQVFHAVLAPRSIDLHYAMELSQREISVKSINLTVDGLNVKGNCAIKDIGSGDPRIVAQATTSHFRLEDFGRYIPYGIIVKEPADFIEQHIKGGTYRLYDGRLDGRVSQILHMERGQNYNVLYIRGVVEKGLITYGPQVPTFNALKGELEMRGKDFNLSHMSGNFGTSPFTLEGKIADYPLDTPSSYPFTMRMTPRQGEVAWLLGREGGQKLAFAGESTLLLKGDGITNGRELGDPAGTWMQGDPSPPGAVFNPGDASAGIVSEQRARAQTLSSVIFKSQIEILLDEFHQLLQVFERGG